MVDNEYKRNKRMNINPNSNVRVDSQWESSTHIVEHPMNEDISFTSELLRNVIDKINEYDTNLRISISHTLPRGIKVILGKDETIITATAFTDNGLKTIAYYLKKYFKPRNEQSDTGTYTNNILAELWVLLQTKQPDDYEIHYIDNKCIVISLKQLFFTLQNYEDITAFETYLCTGNYDHCKDLVDTH